MFDLDWASVAERSEIVAQMPALNRQTMNFRVMPNSRMLCVRARDDNNRLVGWAGLDTEFTRGIGEVFSLYVVPDYRTYLIGIILETARATYLKQARVPRVLVRMESATNTSLLRYRVRSGLVIEAARVEIPPATLALCKQCELYAKQCTSQSYFWIDIDAFLARGIERLGQEIAIENLPQVITLDPERFRRTSRELHPDGPIIGLAKSGE